MADKEYIVKYVISTDVSKAVEGLEAIVKLANNFETPMKELSTAISNVASSAYQLKQNADIKFEPTINISGFKNQLKLMEEHVQKSANRMRNAVYGALTNNAPATKALQSGISNALNSKELELKKYKDNIAELERQLASSTGQAKKKIKKDIAEAKKIEAEISSEINSYAKKTAPVKKVVSNDVAANVTPETIKAWKDVFGNSKNKNLTVKITGKAGGKDGALTIINKLQTQLTKLKESAATPLTVDVMGVLKGLEPIANPPVVKVIGDLVSIQQKAEALPVKVKIMADQIESSNGAKGKKNAGNVLNIVGKVDKAGIIEQIKAIPKQTLPVYMKLSWKDGIIGKQAQLKDIAAKLPPIKINLDISSAVAKLEEFISYVRMSSPQNIVLSASGFANVTSGTSYNSSRSINGGDASQRYEKQKENAIRNDYKRRADSRYMVQKADEYGNKDKAWRNYRQSLYDRLFGIQPVGKDWLTIAQQKRADELRTMAADAAHAFAKPTPYEEAQNKAIKEREAARIKAKQEASLKSIAHHQRVADNLRGGLHNSILPHVSSMEQLKTVAKYRKLFGKAWDYKKYPLGKNLSNAEKHELLSRVAMDMRKQNIPIPFQIQNEIGRLEGAVMQEWQHYYDDKRKKSSAESVSNHQKRIDEMYNKAQRRVLPFVNNDYERAKSVVKYRKYFADARRNTRFSPKRDLTNDRSVKDLLANVARSMRNDGVSVPSWITKEIDNRRKTLEQRRINVENRFKLAQEEKRNKLLDKQMKRANSLKVKVFNAMLPFASSKEQANMLVKYRRYFKNAAKTLNIDINGKLTDADKFSYLNEVSNQMRKSNIAIPWQLQSMTNKLQSKLDNDGMSRASRSNAGKYIHEKQIPFDRRARQWAYPFTGSTSFGDRTPMAVEMAKGMGVMYAIEGAMSAIGNSFSEAVDYQNIMQTTKSILQNGTGTFSHNAYKNMEHIIRDVGIKTKFSAPEVAGAANFLARAGYDIDAINHSIKPIANLALIGDSDLAETADKMTNIMTTFNIKPENMTAAANIMATTAMRSNTDLMMLAESAKYGGGVAQLYGGKDPNLFADTMALFGVMGNAGIQASSAGTALRMMYQNLFKPNKNQQSVLDFMKNNYGITTLNKDGSYRSMSSILIEMAQRIPEDKMAQIVGNLFRITAQPGAASALLAAAGGDANIAQEIADGSDHLVNMMSSKNGLSSLVSLMIANRNSVHGTIAQNIAIDKQNTIQGLWAQVTSTFTEGILRAVEGREGGLKKILNQLKNYLSEPSTMAMMRSFIDMIIEIGKVMATFAKIWADIYSSAPDLVKTWVTTQMFFTQLGTLISPVISLISVFSKLRAVLMGMAGISTGTSIGRIAGVASSFGAAALGQSFVVGKGLFGKPNKIYGKAAMRANKELKNNEILAKELALSGADAADILSALNNDTTQHYRDVQDRANRMYGFRRSKGIAKHLWHNPFGFTGSAGTLLSSVKSLLVGAFNGIVTGIMTFINPVTLIVSALTAAGYGVYKIFQYLKGNTDAQIAAQLKLKEASNEALRAITENSKWYKDQFDQYKTPPIVVGTVAPSETQLKYERDRKKFFDNNKHLTEDLSKDTSIEKVKDHIPDYRKIMNDPLNKMALGDQYDNLVGSGLDANYSITQAKQYSKYIQNKEFQAAIMTSLIHSDKSQQAVSEIKGLHGEYLKGKFDWEEYKKRAEQVAVDASGINNPNLKKFTGMSHGDFLNMDPSQYELSAKGLYNFLLSQINADKGTITGVQQAKHMLKKGVAPLSNLWYELVEKLIDTTDFKFSTDKGQLNINLSMQDKMIDMAKLKADIGEENYTIKNVAKIVAELYQSLPGVPKNKDLFYQFVYDQIHGMPVADSDAKSHYLDMLSPNSQAKKEFSVHGYMKYLQNNNNSAVGYRTLLRQNFAKQAVDEYFRVVPETPSIVTNTNKDKPTDKPSPTNQSDYDSNYGKQTVKPNYVNININELVHFDDTRIEASAGEKELISAMEDKIVNAVYQIFAQASNSAQESFSML